VTDGRAGEPGAVGEPGARGSGASSGDQIRLAREALAAVRADARARGLRPVPTQRRPANGPAQSGWDDETAEPGDSGATGAADAVGRAGIAGPGDAAGPADAAGPDSPAGLARPGTARSRPARRPAARPGFAPQPRRDDPKPLSAAIGGLLDAEGWALAAATGSVFGRWAQIVGADLAAHTTPETLTDGELTVAADSTAWATQVRLLAAQLVKRLNAELGDGTVLRVKVRGPAGSTRKPGEWRVRGGRGPRDTYG
jgi:predicted nucleic acid-binding Zn ribbon protein